MVSTKKTKRFLFPTEEEIVFSSFEEENEEIKEEPKEDFSDVQTRIIKPEIFEDARIAASCMMEGVLNVVVDLSYIVKVENGARIAERIIDFLYGVSLPLNLYITRVNETTFIFSKDQVKE